MTVFTKWWYVLPVDGTDQMWYGFPLPHTRPGGYSMEFVFSIRNYLIDFIVYFVFWSVVIIVIDKLIYKIKITKPIVITTWVLIGIYFISSILSIYYLGKLEWKSDLKKEEGMETGYQFIFQEIERPDYYEYHPEKKN